MATKNRTRVKFRTTKTKADFSLVGGLSNHIKLLREMIIFPLLYGDIYKHFAIKPPRGVIFYGPPGTGKTLVAGALAGEINKESGGKVSFYARKGADILDKWVGESEKKLRELFEKANKTKPSLIFFDELDGLAPERSTGNDQIHTSVVATLLALMDGLEDSNGVVVIGATNRLESVDPALRRPGRFDRELYFPLPDKMARKEILMVHTRTWKQKPSGELLNQLAEMTTAYCGSDLQALCAEAVLCCLKRRYPNISQQKSKMDLDLDTVQVEDDDFYKARSNITPSVHRTGCSKARKLNGFIKPLLQRQLDMILDHIEVLLPHFIESHYKFSIGSGRYVGRLILKASALQGLNTYIVPALLQKLEHLQNFVLDIPENFQKMVSGALQHFPSVLVISRVNDWWDLLDNNSQMSILTGLDDIHSGLPILMIVTCTDDLPIALQEHFFYNSSINIELDDPSAEEREEFFAPLFYSRKSLSVWTVLHNDILNNIKVENTTDSKPKATCKKDLIRNTRGGIYRNCMGRNNKILKGNIRRDPKSTHVLFTNHRRRSHRAQAVYKTAITDLVKCAKNSKILKDVPRIKREPVSTVSLHKASTTKGNPRRDYQSNANSDDAQDLEIYSLWKRVSLVTSRNLHVVQLELLYDTLLASVYINSTDYLAMIMSLESVLSSYENSQQHQS